LMASMVRAHGHEREAGHEARSAGPIGMEVS
jgi:hypothetical protein